MSCRSKRVKFWKYQHLHIIEVPTDVKAQHGCSKTTDVHINLTTTLSTTLQVEGWNKTSHGELRTHSPPPLATIGGWECQVSSQLTIRGLIQPTTLYRCLFFKPTPPSTSHKPTVP